MKLKPLLLTVVLLGAAATATHFLTRTPPPPSEDPRLGQPLLAGEVIENASTVSLAQNGKTVQLTRRSDGSWSVPSYHGLDADTQRLGQLAESLTSATWQRFVTANPDRLKRLELDSLRITFTDASGKATEVQIGKSFEGGGRFVRLGEEQKAFVANVSVWVDSEPKSWADSTLLDVKPEDIAVMSIDFAEGPALELRREKPESSFTSEGLPPGKQVKASQATSAASTLANLRFSDTRERDDAAFTAAKPARKLSLKTFEGRTFTVELLRDPTPAPTPTPAPEASTPPPPAPEKPVFVRIADSASPSRLNEVMASRAFEIYSYTLTSLPESRDAWLEDVPAPTPAPTPPPAQPAS